MGELHPTLHFKKDKWGGLHPKPYLERGYVGVLYPALHFENDFKRGGLHPKSVLKDGWTDRTSSFILKKGLKEGQTASETRF